MKNSLTVVLSLLMIGFSLVAMPASYATYENEDSGYKGESDQFLDIKNANIGTKGDIIKKIFIETRDEIPQDGSEGAFGYGVILSNGIVIATTTHAGVLDSELQYDVNDPVFHNHFVNLTTNEFCRDKGMDPGFAVGDLTFKSPGDLIIDNNIAILKNLPKTSEGITPGTDVDAVASFILRPLIDLTDVLTDIPPGSPIVTICVEDVQPVDPRYVDFFKLDGFDYDNHYSHENPIY